MTATTPTRAAGSIEVVDLTARLYPAMAAQMIGAEWTWPAPPPFLWDWADNIAPIVQLRIDTEATAGCFVTTAWLENRKDLMDAMSDLAIAHMERRGYRFV